MTDSTAKPGDGTIAFARQQHLTRPDVQALLDEVARGRERKPLRVRFRPAGSTEWRTVIPRPAEPGED